jgi:transcriptional regulator with XRE-family HTH domain
MELESRGGRMEKNPMVRLGEAIRRLRNSRGMNQTDLGKAVFLSKSTISDYENGTTPIETPDDNGT